MVLFGPPGVGKGVYCGMLEKDLGIKAFSTGELSRIILKEKKHPLFTQTEMMDMERRVKQGELLDDDTVNRIVQPQLIEAKASGMMFDGYPRTLAQAKYISIHLKIDIVLNLNLREDILIRKLLGRRVCPSCKKSYNIEDVNEGEYEMPPMLPKHEDPTCCEQCDAKLIQREDDNLKVIQRRQDIYNEEVRDILKYYKEDAGVLCQFEPKRGVSDYPEMLQTVVDFINKRSN